MELRQLRYFVAVAEEGNISRAAKKIFLTQPALSRQIKSLEEEIGQCLLERQAHSIRLTRTGELLLSEARELLAHSDQVLQRVRQMSHAVHLRVGYAPSLASGLLSATVESFSQIHSNARVEMFDLSTAEMLAGLGEKKLDLAISVTPPKEIRGIIWTPLIRASWQIALHHKHALSKAAQLTPSDVASQPILVYCQKDYPEYSEMLTNWLGKHRLRPRITGEYDGVDSLLAAVESGIGVALVTARIVHRLPQRVRLKNLAAAPEPLCIGAAYRSDRKGDQVLGVFVGELRKAAQSTE